MIDRLDSSEGRKSLRLERLSIEQRGACTKVELSFFLDDPGELVRVLLTGSDACEVLKPEVSSRSP